MQYKQQYSINCVDYFKKEINHIDPEKYDKNKTKCKEYMKNFCEFLNLISKGKPEKFLNNLFERKEFKFYFENEIETRNNKILKNLSNYYNVTDDLKEKTRLLSCISFLGRKKLKDCGFNLKENSITQANNHIKPKKDENNLDKCRKPGDKLEFNLIPNKPLDEIRKKEVIDFLNANSTISSSHSKQKNGKSPKPVKILHDSNLELHKKYKKEVNNPVSLSTFYKLSNEDFTTKKKLTDLCPLCEQLKRNTSSLKKRINELKLHPNCEIISDDCIFDKCGQTIFNLEKKDEIIEELRNNILLLNRHKELKVYQKNHYDSTVKNLRENEVILIIDFKQNISLNQTDRQISVDWYNNKAATLLGVVLLKLDQNKKLERKYFSLVSEDIPKSNFLVQSALNKFFENEQQEFYGKTNIKLFCDNGPHFRCKEFLSYLL